MKVQIILPLYLKLADVSFAIALALTTAVLPVHGTWGMNMGG